QRRRDRAAHRRKPDGHEFEPGRVRGARLWRHRDGDPAAAAGRRGAPRARVGPLGFGAPVTATLPPRRVGGSPLGSATSLVSGTAANTISWYSGEAGAGSARASA